MADARSIYQAIQHLPAPRRAPRSLSANECEYNQDWSKERCTISRGGSFEPGISSTWNKQTQIQFSGFSANENSSNRGFQFGEDTLAIGGQNLEKSPTVVLEGGKGLWNDRAALGLSQRSSFLEYLVKQGKIQSRSLGLDLGWSGDSDDTWSDGSPTLGGIWQEPLDWRDIRRSIQYVVGLRIGGKSFID